MMWIVASIPFWICGALLLAAGTVGGWLCVREDRTAKDFRETILGALALIMLSGALFMIAAKVAS